MTTSTTDTFANLNDDMNVGELSRLSNQVLRDLSDLLDGLSLFDAEYDADGYLIFY